MKKLLETMLIPLCVALIMIICGILFLFPREGKKTVEPVGPSIVKKLKLVATSGGVEPIAEYDMAKILSVGNYSYIPFNLEGRASDYRAVVLGALDRLENHNPKAILEVISFEHVEATSSHPAFFKGLWIRHGPRPVFADSF